uniref:CSON011360 protein n=1 Tax=Culicoides sonorensis TaxID=179676 RepID=A0A336MFD6_CULSO
MKKINLNNLSFFSLTINTSIIISIIFLCCHFQLSTTIRTASGNNGLLRTTRKPDYSDVYEKIDDNDIFKNIRRIMRIGDPANGVPIMSPFKRDHQFNSDTENELGNVEHQRVEGLDQFVTKSSLIYSNNEKFDFSLLWPKISFISRHSSTRNYRVFYSNYTFVACTMKGEADVQRTSIDENCYKLRDLRLTLHFKNYDVNVVTTSNNENDKEIARTAKQTLDRYIKQEYTLGLEKPAYELEQKIKEYFASYRCLLQEDPPIQRPSRTNDRDDRAFIDIERTFTSEQPIFMNSQNQGNRGNSRPVNDDYNFNTREERPQNTNSYDRDRTRTQTNGYENDNNRRTASQNDPYRNNNNQNTRNSNTESIYFPSNDNERELESALSLNNNQNTQSRPSNPTPYYPQSNRDVISSTSRRPNIRQDPPQRSTASTFSSSNRPSSVTSQNRPIPTQPQRPVNPVYRITTNNTQIQRSTTQPSFNYYEYSGRLI